MFVRVRQHERQSGAIPAVFRPDPPVVGFNDGPANRQPQPTAGAVRSTEIRSVLLEDLFQITGRDPGTGIANVHPVGVWGAPNDLAAFQRGRAPLPAEAAVPKIRLALDLDRS